MFYFTMFLMVFSNNIYVYIVQNMQLQMKSKTSQLILFLNRVTMQGENKQTHNQKTNTHQTLPRAMQSRKQHSRLIHKRERRCNIQLDVFPISCSINLLSMNPLKSCGFLFSMYTVVRKTRDKVENKASETEQGSHCCFVPPRWQLIEDSRLLVISQVRRDTSSAVLFSKDQSANNMLLCQYQTIHTHILCISCVFSFRISTLLIPARFTVVYRLM